MRSLYTLAYPILAPADRVFMDSFRDQYDLPYRNVVAPHFTQVFGCQDIADAIYCDHIARIVETLHPIAFTCRYAMLGADCASPTAHVFLVPDEGYSALSRQHDQLYTGALAPYLRLDIPFTPHITIGAVEDHSLAKHLCDNLNTQDIEIAGRVDRLTVVALEGGKIRDIASFALGR